MTFEEIKQTAAEMQCLLIPDIDETDFTLYAEMEGNDDNSVCWIFPEVCNGRGSISSTYHFPQVDGFENFTKEEMIARIGYIRNLHKELYIRKQHIEQDRLNKLTKDF